MMVSLSIPAVLRVSLVETHGNSVESRQVPNSPNVPKNQTKPTLSNLAQLRLQPHGPCTVTNFIAFVAVRCRSNANPVGIHQMSWLPFGGGVADCDKTSRKQLGWNRYPWNRLARIYPGG